MKLSRIHIHPIKSLDPVGVTEARVLPSGALEHDREFTFVDDSGKVFRGKRDLKLLNVRSEFDLKHMTVALGLHGDERRETFRLLEDAAEIGAWMSRYIGRPLTLRRNLDHGFPDDPTLFGPTVVAAQTLDTVAAWFEHIDAAQVRRRFRANLEVEGAPAFWEDALYAVDGKPKPFRVGALTFNGVAPCERCVVVTRDPENGAGYKDFQQIFMARRKATLPAWANAADFAKHAFMLCLRTQLAPGQTGGMLRVGDTVAVP